MEVPQETINKIPYDPAISLLDVYQKECKSTYKRNTYTSMFVAPLFIITKRWNQLRFQHR
jgi:hypothetical protein